MFIRLLVALALTLIGYTVLAESFKSPLIVFEPSGSRAELEVKRGTRHGGIKIRGPGGNGYTSEIVATDVEKPHREEVAIYIGQQKRGLGHVGIGTRPSHLHRFHVAGDVKIEGIIDNSELSSLRSELSSLRSEVSSLRSEVSSLRSEVSFLRLRLISLENN